MASMGDWNLLVIAVAVLGYAAVSGRLRGSVITAAMVFTAVGLLVGDEGVGWFEAHDPGVFTALTTSALVLVLFHDSVQIELRDLERHRTLPVRLLGLGLPLTIALGTGIAMVVLDDFSLWPAAVLATVLAPTDAALGEPTVSDERVPARIRLALNVESGLNDGLCVPLLAIFLALAEADEDLTRLSALRIITEEIGWGVVGGVVAGIVGGRLLVWARPRGWADERSVQIALLAVPAAAFGLAAPLHGSGFIAAFVAGAALRRASRGSLPQPELVESLGQVLTAATFLVFGAVALGPAIDVIGLQELVYAVLSLTVIRMVPVALALLGTKARPQTVGFVGWFGPRGLASIVFALDLVDHSGLDQARAIVLTAAITVGLSVLLHGLSAAPGAARYGRWFAAHPRPHDLMESLPDRG